MKQLTYVFCSTIFLGLMFLFPGNLCADKQKEMSQIELLNRIKSNNLPVILDVRSREEFSQSHVPGAINIPHNEMTNRVDEIRSHKKSEIVVYCHSGRRAKIAIEALQKHGFQSLFHLQGDMQAWLKSQYPVEKNKK